MKLRGVVGGVLGVCAVFTLSACTDDPVPQEPPADAAPVIQPGRPGEPNKTLSPSEAGKAAPNAQPNKADLDYVTGMIVHHQQAIEMTDLVKLHGVNQQVKALSSRIADTQAPEINMMNNWLRQNGKPTVEPGGGGHGGHGGHDHGQMPGMATPEQMNQLRATRGPEFDKLFLRLMIAHHEGALTMARDVQKNGSVVRVQEMADDVVATQSKEIATMRGMLTG
ncbi:uncharacterized protein (DUF305 family) [Herbihabitans rhizosphaerae]|uniref:Uncharacterized protein (DUF305 family) n=1 Tax=Herbihabitans rhizosphaerae TaxID=1872711 RepID=A0A4Q7KKE5_9PSEU|nr:DUF305 domain-containing protein [Herbihabitans rhizosphaerae]RZS34386.1 uncharacterized protein (DUF305 family) [Herbihabitans rhizosphaerae]